MSSSVSSGQLSQLFWGKAIEDQIPQYVNVRKAEHKATYSLNSNS